MHLVQPLAAWPFAEPAKSFTIARINPIAIARPLASVGMSLSAGTCTIAI